MQRPLYVYLSAGSDVKINPATNLQLTPTQRQRTITIRITDDKITSPNETFKLEIEGFSQNILQNIDPGYLNVRILDNDPGRVETEVVHWVDWGIIICMYADEF